MALDFTTGVLDPRVTFTRASTATFVGSNGIIQTAAINAPRFDYNPATLAPKGLLIEEARTNLTTYSEQFDNAAWVENSSDVTLENVVSPSGASTSYKLTELNASDRHFIVGANVTFVSGTTYTFSIYAKDAGRPIVMAAGNRVFGHFNLQSGVALPGPGSADWVVSGASIVLGKDGWYRCVATVTRQVANTTTGPQIGLSNTTTAPSTIQSYLGDGVSGAYIYGFQIEAGAFATSYIPTVASQVTRNADVVSMTGTNFSDWYNASEGAFLAKFSFPAIPATQFRYVLSANDGTATNFIAVAGNTTSNVPAGRVIASSSTQASMGGGAITANQQAIGVIAYKQDSFAYGQNGATIGTDATGLVPTVNRLDIGALTTSFACCHIQRVAYWPQRIINNEALAFSK
jgi:hypothetical protein